MASTWAEVVSAAASRADQSVLMCTQHRIDLHCIDHCLDIFGIERNGVFEKTR
jgi:hypothetical protein